MSLTEILEVIITAIDVVGILILIIGAFKFTARYLIFEFKRVSGLQCIQMLKDMRIEMGSYILLSLEILIISDVIHSSMSRNINDFYLLGLLVIIRTTIGFFLGKEIKELKESMTNG